MAFASRSMRSLVMLAALASYLFFSLVHLDLPGLQYDEVLFANAALGNLDGTFVEWSVPIAGRDVPLMLMPYIGALKAWLYAPVFAVFGTGVASARMPVVLIGAGTLLITYGLVRSMLGEEIGLVSLLLLAADPAFIFSNKLDWGPVSLMMILKMAALFLIWRWLQVGNSYLLALVALILGLGLFDKVIFVWVLGALAIALPLCFRREIATRWSWKATAIGVTCFLLGCWPLLAYNVKFPLRTFENQKVVTASWGPALRYKYGLFRMTLNGTAVRGVVNEERPGEYAQTMRRETGDMLGDSLAYVARVLPLEGTFNAFALVLAGPALAVLAMLGRLPHARRVVFFGLLLLLISAFICLTAQATGPQHTTMILPFTHIVTAASLVGVARALGARGIQNGGQVRRAALVTGVLILLLPQLYLNAGYLKCFRVHGGVGRWSDAIYELAGLAKQHHDRPFLLMDWGFSNQLLLLTHGEIRKQEAFVPLLGPPSNEEKAKAMYPYLLSPANLLVFHSPQFETFPMAEVFKGALMLYRLEAEPVKIFRQRGGKVVYIACRVVHPEVDAQMREGRFFSFREAEDRENSSGGGIETKIGASNARFLGSSWGRNHTDFVAYHFHVHKNIPMAYFYLRYAFESDEPRRCHVFLDGRLVESVTLDSTGGYGGLPDWRVRSVRLGSIESGERRLVLKPAADDEPVNLDCVYLSEGESTFKPGAFLQELDRRVVRPFEMEVLGFLERPEVRLEVSPAELIAGQSTLTLRVDNFEASSIDMLYSLDGRIMPIVYGWQLDEHRTSRIFVDGKTPRGLYRYIAIRDSKEGSPTGWIRVNVDVPVR